jgi:hypothetical protein
MSRDQIDDYLARVEEPKRSTLERLRRTILDLVPEAQECISYQVPAFRVGGKVIAGFAAFKNHLSYLPFSGSVLKQLSEGACEEAHQRPFARTKTRLSRDSCLLSTPSPIDRLASAYIKDARVGFKSPDPVIKNHCRITMELSD